MNAFHPLVVGCPLWKREWAMPYWFDGIQRAASAAGVEPAYLFVADPRDPVVPLVEDLAAKYDRPLFFEWVEEDAAMPEKRHWNPSRFARMAYLRNRLLARVRDLRPAYFLSIDSDIFLHHQALVSIMENADSFDAIGGKVYMQPPPRQPREGSRRNAPSYAMLRQPHELCRPDSNQVLDVDVIMALKLMSPAAYNVDYVGHDMGEDIGWSIACKSLGLSLGWDGRITSKHAMTSDMALMIDERCGF